MNTSHIACTLPASDLRERTAQIHGLLRDAMIDHREIRDGVRLRFRDKPEIEARVRALVAAEQRCCTFLSFAVGRKNDGLWLEVTGGPEAQEVIAQITLTPANPASRPAARSTSLP